MSAAGIEANKSLYFRFATLLGEDNLEALDELLASGFVDHSLPEDAQSSAEGLRHRCASLVGRLPNLHLTLEDLIAERDRVSARVVVYGRSPTGESISIEVIDIVRIAGDRIAERWSQHSRCERRDDDYSLTAGHTKSQQTPPKTGSTL